MNTNGYINNQVQTHAHASVTLVPRSSQFFETRRNSGTGFWAVRSAGMALALIALLALSRPLLAKSVVTIDSEGFVGQDTSLALDGSGNPVVSYRDFTKGDLKLVHCNDPNCTGGDESIETVDSGGDVGAYTSLALDGSGNPVISYFDNTNGDLKLVHCNDPNCSGGDESIETVDNGLVVGAFTSLALDGSGNPVISYHDFINGSLKLVHCNDANCTGGDESIETVDSGDEVGLDTSLALDGSGNPVISYYDATNRDLKLVHCNDANCTGVDESIETVDSGGIVGAYTSLTLDGSGLPVISYFDITNGDLKLVHCNDANCTGGDESIATVDSGGIVGWYTSLALDGSGYPVVSYMAGLFSEDVYLKLARCNDPDCTGGDESIITVDGGGDAGEYTSLALDGSGNPVISYYERGNGSLKLAHCDDANCTGNGAPEAFADSYTTDEDVTLSVAAPGLLGNDSDPDGDPISALLESSPANGTLSLNADGSFTYTPTLNFTGDDSFTYRASDGIESTEPATVTLTVRDLVEKDVRPLMTESIESFSYDPTATTYAAKGELLVRFKFAYPSGPPLNNISLEVTTADNALLVNADGGPGGVGATLTVLNAELPGGNHLFEAGEDLIVEFNVGIESSPWSLDFNMFGSDGELASAGLGPALQRFSIGSESFNLERQSPASHRLIFLPLVSR